ncbi:hypothetical protein [Candidatus Enterovibrio altilux]|nr:hypothetical protein [Candidatus Enterovibrio luxaltus]
MINALNKLIKLGALNTKAIVSSESCLNLSFRLELGNKADGNKE